MTISTTSKFVAGVVGLSLALAIFVGVGASTAGAQAMTLSQLVDLFISLGIIAPDKAAAAKAAVSGSTTSAGYNFAKDLTIGSTGADVTALQNALGVTPATGYFGTLTQAAVKSYQTSKGIPSTGYVGPLTRAELNKSAGSTTTTGGTTTTPVVNSGVEGTLTVNKSSVPNTTAYEGESMRTVLAFKAEAKLSDINIQRVKLDLGSSTGIYTKVYKTMYLVDDAGRVLAQANLNSNTVVKNGTNYELTLGGFSYTVPKDSTKILTVKADLYSSIDSDDRTSRTVTIPQNGVRGVDGAGIDQYAPGTSFAQSMSINASLIESAALKLSTNSANFKTAEVVASEGSADNEYDKLSLLSFDLRAEKDDVYLTDLVVTVSKSGSGAATTSTIYLMDGNNVLDSEDLSGATTVTFDDLDYLISKDTTKTLVVRADIDDANTTSATFSASIAAAGVSAENTVGDEASVSGTATGENMIVRNIGPVLTLVSKNISKSQSATVADSSTTTVKGTFDLRIKAVGEAIAFGPQSNASTTFNFVVYKDGSAASGAGNVPTSSSTSWTIPSTGVISHASTGFTVQENNEVTIPVEVVFIGNSLNLGSYAIGLDSVLWSTSVSSSTQQTSNFMSGNLDWRTSTVQLP